MSSIDRRTCTRAGLLVSKSCKSLKEPLLQLWRALPSSCCSCSVPSSIFSSDTPPAAADIRGRQISERMTEKQLTGWRHPATPPDLSLPSSFFSTRPTYALLLFSTAWLLWPVQSSIYFKFVAGSHCSREAVCLQPLIPHASNRNVYIPL